MSSGASSAERTRPTFLVASAVPLVPAWRLDRALDYLVPPRMEERVRVGSLVRIPLGRRNVRGVVVELGRRAPERVLEEIADTVLDVPVCPPSLRRIVDWVAERYAAPRGLVLRRIVPPRVRLSTPSPRPLEPGPEPSRLLELRGGAELVRALSGGASGSWSLRPAPGVDRGELAAELASSALRAPTGSVLVLVPEVRFGSRVIDALAHSWPELELVDSTRPENERARAWMALANGARLGVGGRGAVLAPVPDLRLVVVVDEHHPSYKETRTPRFDARRVALERARSAGAICVLLSTSPSLETGHAALEGRIGRVEPLRLTSRAARPIVEFAPRPRDRELSRVLHRRVDAALRAGRRVALLAPARGYARALWCGACRRSLRCPRCESGMSLAHSPSGEGRVRCARCGLDTTAPARCPSCGRGDWKSIGAGSERLAEQIARAWPRARVARADPDELERVPEGRPPDIYVTTWIGTKQELRPDVGLVAVLDADAILRRPNYRAAEDAYQALVTMAEWAGPASAGGRLLVQCSEPGHHALQALARADYGFWLRRELEQRSELGYPPYSELVRLRATGPGAATLLAAASERCRSVGATVLGPVPAVHDGALEALAKCPDAGRAARALRDILAHVPPGDGLSVDVDPR
jgi:primosomal protein N' (replication factor Y)